MGRSKHNTTGQGTHRQRVIAARKQLEVAREAAKQAEAARNLPASPTSTSEVSQ